MSSETLKIDQNKTIQHYSTDTMFGTFKVGIEKKKDRVIARISSAVLSKEFAFDRIDLIKTVKEFLEWIQ